MKDRNFDDIGENEVRIIHSVSPPPPRRKRLPLWLKILLVVVAIAVIGLAVLSFFNPLMPSASPVPEHPYEPTYSTASVNETVVHPDSTPRGYTSEHTIDVDGTKLIVLTPHNATPVLEIGPEVVDDPDPVLIAQAADVRGDNGGIVSAFVRKGELISKGAAKTGFCAIIDGKITIGVADATPLLEEALEKEGYFFRQYPLVVSGMVVDNRPKGEAMRKALAEMADGSISVVLSTEEMTFHDFAQALADAGVRNAIYLVGSIARGRYTDAEGQNHTFGQPTKTIWDNINYIVWQ